MCRMWGMGACTYTCVSSACEGVRCMDGGVCIVCVHAVRVCM